MKKLLFLCIFAMPLVGCTASIGTVPPTTTTTYTAVTPASSTTTYSTPVSKTTVTKTAY
jgi:hypothetical protein